MLKKAENLKDVPNVFNPAPLTVEELDSFHVNSDDIRDENISPIYELKTKLGAGNKNSKILFAGHRGSGKSTELNRLKKEISDKYFIINFSLKDEYDIYNIEYMDIIFGFMEKVFSEGKEKGYFEEHNDKKLLEHIYTWFNEITKTKIEGADVDFIGEGGIDTKNTIIGKLIGVFGSIKTSLKMYGKQQTEIRTKLDQRMSTLKDNCNLLINALQMKSKMDGKKILIIIEDTDKLERKKAENIFFEHSGLLNDINVNLIFSTHIFLLNSALYNAAKYECVTLPMIKIKNKNNSKNIDGISILKEIVYKRMNNKLIVKAALDLAIEKSGGNIRDLFEIIEQAAISANYKEETKITTARIQYGIGKLMNAYNRTTIADPDSDISTEMLYDKLVEMYNEGTLREHPQDKILLSLLNCQAVLEYSNGEHWFDINPIVVDNLKAMKKV